MSCDHDCDRPLRFPAEISNRPGLARFRYRIGDYASMRAHMLDQLVKAPALAGWTHLGSDEPGIALLEGTALVGDILTFYQELYCNETKLPTAAWQESVFDLVRLTGYRPAPGLGGVTVFALEVDEKVVVPAGFAFQARLEGFDQPSLFESKAAIQAFPAFGAFHLYGRRQGQQPIKGATSLDIHKLGGRDDLVTRRDHGIEAGDRLLIMSGPFDPHEILVVAETEEHLDRVTLHLEGRVQENHPSEVTAFKIGRTFRHFGADAPRRFTTFEDNPPKSTQHKTAFLRETGTETPKDDNHAKLDPQEMPLDQEVDDLAAGSEIVCVGRIRKPSRRDFVLVRRVDRITPRSTLWAGATAPVSMVRLNKSLHIGSIKTTPVRGFRFSSFQFQSSEFLTASVPTEPPIGFGDIDDFVLRDGNDDDDEEKQDIRRLRLYETLSETMILRAPPRQVGSVRDGRVNYFGTREEARALADRRVLFAGQTEAPEDIVISPDQPELALAKGPPDDRRMWPIQLGVVPESGANGFDEAAPGVTVYGNLVDATEGESQAETAIGSGDSRRSFQTFPLAKPLTFLADPVRSPPFSAELEVRVNGRLWQAVSTFFDAAPDAEIYVIRQTEDGVYVQFGDGINGARPPSGRNNVTAAYRTGSGSFGDLAAEEEPKAKGKLNPLTGVLMPGPATGGAAPEQMVGARDAAPGRMQSLGRLVGLTDFEAEALSVPGVLKAGAVFGAEAERPLVSVTVLTEDESAEAISAVEAALRHADRCRGPARYPLEVIGGRRRYVHLSLLLSYDPSFRPEDLNVAIKKALGALPAVDGEAPEEGVFSLDQRQFGQDVHLSQVMAAAQAIEGVVWVRTTAFGKLPPGSGDPADLTARAGGVTPRLGVTPSEVLALSEHHLTLSVTAAVNDEECPA